MKAKRPGRPEGKLCHPHSQELQRQPQSMLFPLCSAKITLKTLLGWNATRPPLLRQSRLRSYFWLTKVWAVMVHSYIVRTHLLVIGFISSPRAFWYSYLAKHHYICKLSCSQRTSWSRVQQHLGPAPAQVLLLALSQFGKTEKAVHWGRSSCGTELGEIIPSVLLTGRSIMRNVACWRGAGLSCSFGSGYHDYSMPCLVTHCNRFLLQFTRTWWLHCKTIGTRLIQSKHATAWQPKKPKKTNNNMPRLQ